MFINFIMNMNIDQGLNNYNKLSNITSEIEINNKYRTKLLFVVYSRAIDM